MTKRLSGAPRPSRSVAGARRPVPANESAAPVALRLVASVIAPTTVLTALLFYYGRLHAQSLTRQLRVQFTVLDFSFQDYVVRSADGLFTPLVAVAVVGLVCLWVARSITARWTPTQRRTVLRVWAPTASVLGLALLAAAWIAGSSRDLFRDRPEFGGLCLALGVLCLSTAGSAARRGFGRPRERTGEAGPAVGAIAKWTLAFLLVSAGLFWAVNDYAARVGTARGMEVAARLPTEPDVVLYSDKNLNLQVPGARSTFCAAVPDPAGFRYRYEGLKLVLQSGGQYLLLPATWNQIDGVSLVVPRGSGMRLEFSAPGRPPLPSC
ncbi:hypothetical protein [Actinomycetospora atypica]|uniref:Uncharacterized protein n=1 Tax=Actinomycetospora atypica TaxID=1290095 RepID=A0ABV9YN54_9PSEU